MDTMAEKPTHLYHGKAGAEERREFIKKAEKEGKTPEEAKEYYGKVVGKVRREREAKHHNAHSRR